MNPNTIFHRKGAKDFPQAIPMIPFVPFASLR